MGPESSSTVVSRRLCRWCVPSDGPAQAEGAGYLATAALDTVPTVTSRESSAVPT
jgi:hypothetical protein